MNGKGNQFQRRREVQMHPALVCALVSILVLASCAVGPNYKRPSIKAPSEFRGETRNATNSFADLPWWEVFHDDTLQQLIRVALTNNYDLRIAITRVEQARAIAAEARSGFFPQVSYDANLSRNKNVAGTRPTTMAAGGTISFVDASASWEIDLWGRVRRLNEAARAQYFASEEGRRDLLTSVVAQVAQSYFQLLALDDELEIARRTTNAFAGSLKIFNRRLQGGVASKLETASAQALLESAAATIPQLERQIALQENQLSVLLGQNPGPIARRGSLEKQMPPDVPAGLPSTLLERRPDIRAAGQQLRSANAQVGVVIASIFPQLNLTGLFGRVGPELTAFTAGGAGAWSIAAGLTGPLFQGGRLFAQYRQSKAAREQFALQYQAAALNAFQEVSDALISREKLAEARELQSRAVEAYREAVKISVERYRFGQSSYYEVLQEQQLLFPAENALAQIRLNQLLAVVQLYRALGGGWQMDQDRKP
jgi:multidrug efflux system outer membrane protein